LRSLEEPSLVWAISRGGAASGKGILLSFIGGIGAGLFYPLVAKSLAGPGHLTPYTVNIVFALGAAAVV
jgi:hypothetical protein